MFLRIGQNGTTPALFCYLILTGFRVLAPSKNLLYVQTPARDCPWETPIPPPTTARTFSVFDVRTDIPGKLLPVAIFDQANGEPRVLPELARFLYEMLRQGMSLPKLRSIANTVGLLHDFLLLHEKCQVLTAETLPSLILRFLVARCAGTIGPENTDPSGLFWRPSKYETYKIDRRNLRLYSEYCVRTYGFLPLTPTVILEDFEARNRHYSELRSEFRRSKHEFLVHLRSFRQEKRAYGPSVGGRYAAHRTGASDNRTYIPYDELKAMILGTKSVVQRMVFVAGAFAGPRISEQLNMWREDVLPGRYRPLLFPDDRASDIPLVILAHPYASQYVGRMSIDGTSRTQHLKSKYGRVPRPEMDKAARAGWKGMLMDNEQLQISQLFWISEAWAAYYYELVTELKQRILPQVPEAMRRSHPYLLINDNPKGEFFGMPLKRGNLRKSWERACRRIGQEPYRGPYHLHGLRGTFTHALRRCSGIEPADRQRYLHHLSVESQAAYGNDPAILHAHLKLLELQRPELTKIQ